MNERISQLLDAIDCALALNDYQWACLLMGMLEREI